MTNLFNHIYIIATIFFGVYSQLIMRWQVSLAGGLPLSLADKITFIGRLLLNPWIISSIIATFFAGISWMLAMTKFETSYAYPFMTLQLILIVGLSVFLFNESFSLMKLAGTSMVLIGIILLSKS